MIENFKTQLKSCNLYDCELDKWTENKVQLNIARSQSSSCIFEKHIIYIFGGFNKEFGVLKSIEKYDIDLDSIMLLKVTMPIGLRRFGTVKISKTKILIVGGMGPKNTKSDIVY